MLNLRILQTPLSVMQSNINPLTNTPLFVCRDSVLNCSKATIPHGHLTHPPTGPVEGTLEHRPQLAVDIETFLMSNYPPNKKPLE